MPVVPVVVLAGVPDDLEAIIARTEPLASASLPSSTTVVPLMSACGVLRAGPEDEDADEDFKGFATAV